MPQNRSDNELVGLLYDAAGEAGHWPEFLGAVSKRFDAPGVGLIFHCPSVRQFQINANVGLPEESFQPYAKHYGALDPWGQILPKLSAGTAELGSAYYPPHRFKETGFYIDFLRKHRPFLYQCGVVLENSHGNYGVLSCLREPGQRDFSKQHLRLLNQLSGHLQRALWVHRRILDGQQASAMAMDVVGRFDAGLIVVAGDGTICATNSKADDILRAGKLLAERSKRLVCKDRLRADAFKELLRTAVNPTIEQTAGGVMRLHDGGSSLYVTVVPHVGQPHFLASLPMAVVVLSDPAGAPKSREHSLKVLFGLTQAEARIAMLLLHGYETNEIADWTGNTVGTVRYQLKQVYAKTGLSGQGKVMRLLSQLPGQN